MVTLRIYQCPGIYIEPLGSFIVVFELSLTAPDRIDVSEFRMPVTLTCCRVHAQPVMRSSASPPSKQRALNEPARLLCPSKSALSLPEANSLVPTTHQSAKHARSMFRGLSRAARTGAGTSRNKIRLDEGQRTNQLCPKILVVVSLGVALNMKLFFLSFLDRTSVWHMINSSAIGSSSLAPGETKPAKDKRSTPERNHLNHRAFDTRPAAARHLSVCCA